MRVSTHKIRLQLRRLGIIFRMGLSNQERDYTRGPINSAVILLAIPMVLEMVMESVFVIVDMFWVAKLGADAIAAVGLTEAVITIVYAVAVGLSMSTTAMVARRIGEKNPEGAAIAAAQSLWLGLAFSLLVAVAGLLYAEDILRLMGASEAVIEQGSGYITVMLCGSVSILYIFLLNAIFRGAGDANIAMRSLWLANGINLVLDPILIFGWGPIPAMGVTGAAVATTIGRSIGVAYQLYHLFGLGGRIRVRIAQLALHIEVAKRLARLSLGGIGQFLIAVSSWIFLMRIVAPYGSAAIAGYTIAVRIIHFTFLPAWGLGNAAATLVGQNLGAGRPYRAERSIWRAAKFNFITLGIVAVALILTAEQVIAIFTTEPEVIAVGAEALRFFCYGYPLMAIGMVAVQSLNGAGDTDTPTLINFIAFWLIELPLAWWLANPMGMGPLGVFWAVLIAESVFSVLAIWVIRCGNWKLRTV
ncbi:MAG: MATE family efflux transporter [Pseudomonadota bacterium]